MANYASASDVAVLCGNLLGGASAFSTSSSPTLTSVCQWIAGGNAIINSHFAAWRYDVPAPVSSAAYPWLTDLNALYAAGRAEMTRTNITLSMGERTRGQILSKDFWDQLGQLRSMDLTLMGMTRTSVGGLWTGGISVSDKQLAQQDTDMVQPGIRRGQFELEGRSQSSSIDNEGLTTSSS